MLEFVAPFDNGGKPGGQPKPNMLGCAEFIASLRSVIEKTADWGEVCAVAQLDVVMAYDTAPRTEAAEAMHRHGSCRGHGRRGMPLPVIGMYIRE